MILSNEAINQKALDFEHSQPEDVLTWAVETFGDKLALTTSFQPTGIATLHMLYQIAPGTPVLTMDTGLLFPQTYRLMAEIEARLDLNLIRIRPEVSVSEQGAMYGENMWEWQPDQCCALRKVQPLREALREYDAWIAGLRRDQSPSRKHISVVAADPKSDNLTIRPLANWTDASVWDYIRAHDLPYNSLHDQGYPSIGCWPCTNPVRNADGYTRMGRWSTHMKTECGLHFQAVP